MVGILLKYLKLASTTSVDGYIYCMPSESLPGYYYFVHEKELDEFTKECKNPDIMKMLREEADKFLLSLLNCNTIKEFESRLFSGFSDYRYALSRMEILKSTEVSNETDWISKPIVEKQKVVSSLKMDTILQIPQSEYVTLAEYDATIQFLKSLDSKSYARYGVLKAIVETMELVDANPAHDLDDVEDVLFQHLIFSLQAAKNVSPISARRFLTYILKIYISSLEGGKENGWYSK